MNKIDRIRHLSRFLGSPGHDIEVFGMFGVGNLGDEAMYIAADDNIPGDRCVPSPLYTVGDKLLPLAKLRKRKHLLVAGGTLIHGGRTDWLDYIEFRANQGAEVAIMGAGVGFLDSEVAEKTPQFRRWSALLAKVEKVALRGTQSVARAQEMGTQADVFGDFAFLLHDPGLVVSDHAARDGTIGVNVGQCLGDQSAFETTMAELVQHISASHPLVFYTVVAADLPVTRRVIEIAGLTADQYRIEAHHFDPKAFMRAVARHSAFVSLKLHASGLAMIAGVPGLMFAYKPKAHDFMTPLGNGAHLVLDLPLDRDDLIARTEALLTNPADHVIEKNIAQQAAVQRAMIRKQFE